MSLLLLFQNIRATLTKRVLGMHLTTGINDLVPLAGHNNTLHHTTLGTTFRID